MGGFGSGWFASAGHVSQNQKDEWSKRIGITAEIGAIEADEAITNEVVKKLPKEVLDYEHSFGDYGSSKLESTALFLYSGTHYERQNYFLRNGRDLSGEDNTNIRWEIPELDNAIEKSPPVPKGIELYRGVGQETGSYLSKIKVGETIRDEAFQSHTLSLNIAARFAVGFGHPDTNSPFAQKTIIRAVTDGKVKGLYTNRLKEHEMIIPRNTVWKVMSVDKIVIPRPKSMPKYPWEKGSEMKQMPDITYNIISVEPW